MFRASLCPSSGEQDSVLPHMVFCTGCAGCGCVELGRELCALCEGYCSTHTVHTACYPAPHNHSQHNQCRTPYAVIHGLVFLMMCIMMPETCWDRSLIINTWLVASCWFLSLHRNILIFNVLMSFTCFELEGSSSGRRLHIQIWYRVFCMLKLQYKAFVVISPRKTHYTMTVFLKMNHRFRNINKISKN